MSGWTDGCDAQDVRMFNVQHINGLEFEAVFFVARLAERLPTLRPLPARGGEPRSNVLGDHVRDLLPAALEPVRLHFRRVFGPDPKRAPRGTVRP